MNVANLTFFNQKGHQILTQGSHLITFAVIGSNYRKHRMYGWQEDAYGFIDTDKDGKVVSCSIIKGGSTFGFEPAEVKANVENAGDSDAHGHVITSFEDALKYSIDEVKIKIDGRADAISIVTGDIHEIFDIEIGSRQEHVRTGSNDDFVTVYYIKSMKVREGQESFLLDRDVKVYPSTQFLGHLMLEDVATELASCEMIYIFEKGYDENGKEIYRRPRSNTQNLRLEFHRESDIKVIKSAEEWNNEDLIGKEIPIDDLDQSKVYWSQYKAFDLVSEYNDETVSDRDPLMMSVGAKPSEEGCYQDILNVIVIDNVNQEKREEIKFTTIGYIACKCEAIGEDERYRTLFTNFGIPDPKEYPTLFKDVDYLEEGTDWKYINKKSKELFLGYQDIFPYVGTYKALINAVKFLGYEDIYFKEWYQFFDGEVENKVATQPLEVKEKKYKINGEELDETVLGAGSQEHVTIKYLTRRIGTDLNKMNVSLDEFLKWKKLSQITMVYKINERQSDYDTVDYFTNSDTYVKTFTTTNETTFEVPGTANTYHYYNNAVLAKLVALKEWLEKYIIGVNCRIVDITGEGVYFSRFKERGYGIGYTTFDWQKEETLSPRILMSDSSTELIESSALLCCTVKELQERRRFIDCKDAQIADLVINVYDLETGERSVRDSNGTIRVRRRDASGNLAFDTITYQSRDEFGDLEWYVDASGDTQPLMKTRTEPSYEQIEITAIEDTSYLCTIGNTYDNALPYLDIAYELRNDASCGTLKKDMTVPLLVKDGEMYVYGLNENTSEFVNPPIIRVARGKLRKTYGRWNSNVEYSIGSEFDLRRQHYRYKIKSTADDASVSYSDYVTLVPREGASCKFTKDNKYNVPMLIIENYDTHDHFFRNHQIAQQIALINGLRATDLLDASVLWFGRDDVSWNSKIEEINTSYDNRAIDLTKTYQLHNKFIIEINDGFICKMEDSESDNECEARLVFEEFYNDGTETNEQDVHVRYTYKTPRKQIISFDIDHYIDDLHSFVPKEKSDDVDFTIIDSLEANERTEALNDLNLYTRKINEEIAYTESLREWQPDFIVDEKIETYNGLLAMAQKFYDMKIKDISLNYAQQREDLTLLNDVHNNLIDEENLLDKYELMLKNYTFWDRVKIKVNHIGDYTITAKGWDGYNTIFTNKALFDNIVYGKVPTVYIENHLQTGSIASQAFDSLDDKPLFWPNYRRFITDASGFTQFKYQNYSYIYDTPKRDGFIKIDNVTERVTSLLKNEETKSVYLTLLDENPGSQNVFYQDASVNLYFVDSNSHEAILTTDRDGNIIAGNAVGPFKVDRFNPTPIKDIDEADQSWMQISYEPNNTEFQSLTDDIYAMYQRGDCECYIGNITAIELTKENIANDYKTRTCTITFKDHRNFGNLLFMKDQCVKIIFKQLTYEGQTSNATDSSTTVDMISKTYVSGTSYRVIEASYDAENFTQIYKIDGLVNVDLLEPKYYKNGVYNHLSDTPSKNIIGVPFKVECTITAAYSAFTSYILRVTDSKEKDDIGTIDYKDWIYEEDHIDRTFSILSHYFNPRLAFIDWHTSADTYYEHEGPATWDYVDDEIIATSRDENHTFNNDGYMSIWDVTINQGLHVSDNTLLYQVINPNASIKLTNPGEYHFRLGAIDIYGNYLKNDLEGFVKTYPQD